MASSAPHWTDELPPLVACSLLPKLPDLRTLREIADASVRISLSDRASTSTSAPPGADLLFHAQRLHDAVRACVEADPDIPIPARNATTLLLTAVAVEDYARSHSTKARLVASHNARAARAAAEQLAGAARAAADAGDPSEREERELLEFLLRSGRPQIIERLLAVLGEPEAQRLSLTRLLAKYSPVDIAAILKATRRAFETGDTARTDGSGSRTLGGVFYREAKRYKASNDRQLAQELLPPLPPLWAYQRDMVGVALTSWGMQLPEEVLARCEGEGEEEEGGEVGAREALRQRALLARFRALAGDWSGNWLVSAPTNSGKTRMFVEVTRGVISSKPADGPCALVVVLVPNVILTNQHAAALDAARLPRTLTGAYSSDNPLTSKCWGALRIAASRGGHHSVVVVTAESFVNLLRSGQALLEEVDLLVLDEAHHCKDDHPYAVVMERFYSNGANGFATTLAKRPRVLAVTASPASEKDLTALDRRMEELLQRLGPARLHLVDAADPRVARVLPEPSQRTVHVFRRSVDREVMLHLQDMALDVALDVEESLVGACTAGSTAAADKDRLIEALHAAVEACQPAAGQLLPTRLDSLGQWLSGARVLASRYGCPNLDLACRLLDVLRKAVELLEDAGFEGSLPFLCRKVAVLCRDDLNKNGGIGAGVRGPNIPPCPPPVEARRQMWEAVAEAQGAAAAAAAGAGSGGVRAWAAASLARGGVGGAVPQVLASLAGAAAALPSAHSVAEQIEAARTAATAPPPGNSCADISVRVSELIKKWLMGEEGLLSSCEGGDLVPDCFASGQLKEDNTFPKFWALIKYLQGYQHREHFHGVIFVRTRQAVFHITDMIRRTQQLQFMEVLELIGHNSTSKRTALAPEQDRHGRGMSDTQQQQVLALFKEPGRKVLVATSAAEEGLDVPSCEFVVRYNAAATGIQLLQSRGRARQKVAEFLAILQDGTLDSELHAKSHLEESNMHTWQRTVAALSQGAALP